VRQGVEQVIQDLHLARRVPGYQYVAVTAHSTLVELSQGYAELVDRPMSLDTTMMAYSMSKTITAVAVLQLAEHGSIGLSDSLSRYLPWQPYGNDVTVRELLSHTAGIPNPIPLRWVHLADEHELFDERAALRDVLRERGTVASRPGTRFAYSNIGYWLLGTLIEQVTSNAFSAYITENVFTPLGLTANDMAYSIVDVRKHATGYLERFSLINLIRPLLIDRSLVNGASRHWVVVRPHYPNGPAFGGVVGTARAFGKFMQDQLLDQSRIVGPAAKAYLIEQQRSTRGPVPMTLGWHMGSLGPYQYLFKEGGGGGFHSAMRLYKSRGIGTVFMANATTVSVSRILDRLDGWLVGATG
jgi:CubicO group peptidase (beta-lactamase class C family)